MQKIKNLKIAVGAVVLTGSIALTSCNKAYFYQEDQLNNSYVARVDDEIDLIQLIDIKAFPNSPYKSEEENNHKHYIDLVTDDIYTSSDDCFGINKDIVLVKDIEVLGNLSDFLSKTESERARAKSISYDEFVEIQERIKEDVTSDCDDMIVKSKIK